MDVSNKQRSKETNLVYEDHFIEKVMTFSARKPLISFLLICLITVFSGFGLLKLKIDTRYDSMLSDNDHHLSVYHEVVTEFGSDNLILIYYQDNNLLSADNIKIVQQVSDTLQHLEMIEKVESITTSPLISHTKEGLKIARLIDLPTEIAKQNILYNSLITDHQLSKDGKKAAIIVTLKPRFKQSKFDRQIYALIEQTIQPLYQHFDTVFQMGNPRITVEFEQGLLSDLSKITPLAGLVLLITLIILLRTSMAALLPLVTSILSIIWALGFLGYCAIPINLLTVVVPALIIVIGSAENTHMLIAYLHHIAEHKENQPQPAIRFMAVHVGLPIFLTSLITVIGFLAHGFSEITLISHFSISSALGMLANLIATILVLPALLQLFGPRHSRVNTSHHWITKIVQFVERATEIYQKKIIIISTLILVFFGFFTSQVTVSNDPLSFFKEDNQIVKDNQRLHQNLAGMQVFFVTVHAARGKDFRQPSELKKLHAVQSFLDNQGIYDNILSINDYLRLVNRESHAGQAEFYKIPNTQVLIEDYLKQFQPQQIKSVLSHDYRSANIIVRHNISDSATLNGYLDDLSFTLQDILKKDNNFSVTGKNLIINKAAEYLFINQIGSVVLLVAVICISMSLLYASLSAGLITLVPNLIPVIVMFGTMSLLGITLNPGTAIVAVIAIEIAIDNTIHILTTYNKKCRIDGDQIAATRHAIKEEAIPVITTALALAAGFLVLTASQFTIVAQFGLLSALTMITVMLSDLFITPILFKHIRLVSLWDVIALNIGQQVLTKSEIFAGMTPFQMKRVMLLSQMREYQAGEAVIRQGEIDDKLFIVIAGKADIILHEENPQRKKIIAHLSAGDVFGEAGYVGDIKRTATVRVLEDKQALQVIMLNYNQVQSAMRFYPRLHAKLNHNICKILAQRLSERTQMKF